MNPELSIRSTVHFSGRVQGVGFRYTVFQVAKEFEITGFVRNLADGRVLLVAEGERGEVERFVDAISERMTGFIRRADRSEATGPRAHQGFTIQ